MSLELMPATISATSDRIFLSMDEGLAALAGSNATQSPIAIKA
jgi:hypothetical protein